MSTNRELYFQYKKEGIPDTVIYFALEECNGFDHLLLTNAFGDEIKDEKRFHEAMNRYQNGEMIEYVFNKAYFLSKPFYVDKNVLIPRQETEQLVLETAKLIKNYFNKDGLLIADVCTGSGCIGLSLAHIFKNNKFILSDISKEALDVAKKNADNQCLNNVSFLLGDMLEPFKKQATLVDVIVCNPPYIEDIKTIDQRTWEHEPHLALLANPGTTYYERVLKDYKEITGDKCLLCFEIGEDLEDTLTLLIKKYCAGNRYSFIKDIYGKTRFLFIAIDKKIVR